MGRAAPAGAEPVADAGAAPAARGRFIANGGFKIGFGMAPMVGEVMADLMLDGTDRIPDGFRPEASM